MGKRLSLFLFTFSKIEFRDRKTLQKVESIAFECFCVHVSDNGDKSQEEERFEGHW